MQGHAFLNLMTISCEDLWAHAADEKTVPHERSAARTCNDASLHWLEVESQI